MQKKIFLQFSLFGIILIIIIFFYKNYFDNNKLAIVLQETEKKDVVQSLDSANIIYNIEYIAEDNGGNKYLIKANYGELQNDQSNLILLKEVTAVINVDDASPINITSDNAMYDNKNYDTEFYGNVIVTYVDHYIASDNLDLYFKKDLAEISNNVLYKNLNTTLQADKIEMDLLSKNSKIYMYNNFQKVKVINKS